MDRNSLVRLDWQRLLGFEQIAERRDGVRSGRIAGKVGGKVGDKGGKKWPSAHSACHTPSVG